jgi:hypothetical protein
MSWGAQIANNGLHTAIIAVWKLILPNVTQMPPKMAEWGHSFVVITPTMSIIINTTKNNLCQCIGQTNTEYQTKSFWVTD